MPGDRPLRVETGFDKLENNIVGMHDDPNVVVAMFGLAGAAVRAYCPEHIDELEEWVAERLNR